MRIVESLPEIGGQLTALYPEKWIYDVLGQPRVLAVDLVAALRSQALQFSPAVELGVTATAIEQLSEGVRLVTSAGEFDSRALIVAGGHGAVEPRVLPDVDVSGWIGRGVAYVVGSKASLAGKRVVVVGGGDSALDWVLNLVDVAESVTLVHRREGFRAHPVTVSAVSELASAGRVDVRVPCVLRSVRGDGRVTGVELLHRGDGSVALLECDEVLLQLGFVSRLGPLADWGFVLDGGSLVVDGLMRTSVDRVWACGDVVTYPGKLKLIATGFGEAAVAVAQAVHSFRPEMQLQPGYSTNTGVPGVVEGQV